MRPGPWTRPALRRELAAVLADPVANAAHPQFAEVAQALRDAAERPPYVERPDPAPYRIWGDDLEPTAVDQLKAAVRLPVAVSAALMPDAHLGYGLPIGGVLATDNAVIPYAVGVDIACRMRLTVYDVPAEHLARLDEPLTKALQKQTLFGVGATFQKPNEHAVLDADWTVSPVTRRSFTKARDQLGSSGSGNHFAEFGVFTLDEPELGLPPGRYLALLTHSGSRGTGAAVADFYSKLAMDLHPDLPADLRRLAWLGLDTEAGQEYWAAMELMGRYAAANHEIIHRRVTAAIGAQAIASIENHHNFAWKERHDGRDVIVHRKGATPAGRGVLGVIPGSMADPRLRRPRPGRAAVARQRQPRGRPGHEPHRRPQQLPLGRRPPDPGSGRRQAPLGRHRRGPGGLQGHPHRHGRPAGPGRRDRPLRPEDREDGRRRREARRLTAAAAAAAA